MTDLLAAAVASAKRSADERERTHGDIVRARVVSRTDVRPGAFAAALAEAGIRIIAECKRRSPSRGILRGSSDAPSHAVAYARAGAAAISVITEPTFFDGAPDHLADVRAVVDLPLLRKDFLLDSYQLVEARLAGADAVLLIAECLDDCNLRKLHNEAIELGLAPLVEFYDPNNLPRVLEAGATLIGVNNRDLHTFAVDLEHTVRMRRQIPDECVLVGESGIHSRADALRLQEAGVDAILVGEHLMAARDIGAAVRDLLGR